MQKINNKYIKSIVYHALREDLKPSGDITSKNINKSEFTNITFVTRSKIKEVITYSTHLLITAPPDNKGCPIFNKFSVDLP